MICKVVLYQYEKSVKMPDSTEQKNSIESKDKNPSAGLPEVTQGYEPKEIQASPLPCVSPPSSNDEISKTRFSLSFSDWLNVLQVIALICAGGWTMFIFVKFEARDKEIAFQLQQASLQKSALEMEQVNSKRFQNNQLVFIKEIDSKNIDGQKTFLVVYNQKC